MHPANERQRYNVMSSLIHVIGWAHSQNDPWLIGITDSRIAIANVEDVI